MLKFMLMGIARKMIEMLSLAQQRYLEGQDQQLPKINISAHSMPY